MCLQRHNRVWCEYTLGTFVKFCTGESKRRTVAFVYVETWDIAYMVYIPDSRGASCSRVQ